MKQFILIALHIKEEVLRYEKLHGFNWTCRSYEYSLTQSGEQFIEEHISRSNQYLETIVNSLSKADQQRLLSAFDEINDILSRAKR